MLQKSRYKSHNPIPSHNFDGNGIYDLVKSVNLLQCGRHDDVFNLLTVIVPNHE